MVAASFVMVLMGCSNAAASCETIATLPVAYSSEASCRNSRTEIMAASSGLGYARIEVECRPNSTATATEAKLRNPTS